jgi:hypothetical protein
MNNKSEKRDILLCHIIPINKCGRSNGNGKSPLGKHCSNNCWRQDLLMDAEISGWKNGEKQKQNIFTV